MKKWIMLLVAAGLVLNFAGCGDEDEDKDSNPTDDGSSSSQSYGDIPKEYTDKSTDGSDGVDADGYPTYDDECCIGGYAANWASSWETAGYQDVEVHSNGCNNLQVYATYNMSGVDIDYVVIYQVEGTTLHTYIYYDYMGTPISTETESEWTCTSSN